MHHLIRRGARAAIENGTFFKKAKNIFLAKIGSTFSLQSRTKPFRTHSSPPLHLQFCFLGLYWNHYFLDPGHRCRDQKWNRYQSLFEVDSIDGVY